MDGPLAMNEGRCSWHRGKAIGHNWVHSLFEVAVFKAQILIQVVLI